MLWHQPIKMHGSSQLHIDVQRPDRYYIYLNNPQSLCFAAELINSLNIIVFSFFFSLNLNVTCMVRVVKVGCGGLKGEGEVDPIG